MFVSKLTGVAAFTGASPGRSQRGAALRLQRGSVDVDLAAVVLYRQPTRTLHTVCGAEVKNSGNLSHKANGVHSFAPLRSTC